MHQFWQEFPHRQQVASACSLFTFSLQAVPLGQTTSGNERRINWVAHFRVTHPLYFFLEMAQRRPINHAARFCCVRCLHVGKDIMERQHTTKSKNKNNRGPVLEDAREKLLKDLRFDAYAASTRFASHVQLIKLVKSTAAWRSVREERFNKGSYRNAVFFEDHRGRDAVSVRWNWNECFLEVKGERTPEIVSKLRALYKHQVSRVDVCIDRVGKTAYARLLRQVMLVKRSDSRLRGNDPTDKDHPEDGRGYRFGSVTSELMVRLYEKGRSPEFRGKNVNDWVRLEWQIRPKTKQRKQLASTLDPLAVLMINGTARKLAQVVCRLRLERLEIAPELPSRTSEVVQHVLRQYKGRFIEHAKDIGGVQNLLALIGKSINGQEWICHPVKKDLFPLTGGLDLTSAMRWVKGELPRSREPIGRSVRSMLRLDVERHTKARFDADQAFSRTLMADEQESEPVSYVMAGIGSVAH